MVYKYPYIYAIGGKKYDSILRSCERFNLKTNKWERIGSLNFRRSSAVTLVINK